MMLNSINNTTMKEGMEMQKVMITCPFTGLEFEAVEYADGRFIATNAITGEDLYISYNPAIDRYLVDKNAFKHVKLMTLAEAAEELHVSKAYASMLATRGELRSVRPGASVYVTKDSVLCFKGRKHKEERASDGAGVD